RFRSRLTVQVSSPKQVFTQPDDRNNVDELALKTDPILSEALILTTQRLALRVVSALGLQLELNDPHASRGDVLADVRVDSTARSGSFSLQRRATGGYTLKDNAGRAITQGGFDAPIMASIFSGRVLPVEAGERVDGLHITSREEAASLV